MEQSRTGLFWEIISRLEGGDVRENKLVKFTVDETIFGTRCEHLEVQEESAQKALVVGRSKILQLEVEMMKIVHESRSEGVAGITSSLEILPFICYSSPLLSLLKRSKQEAICTTMESMLAYGEVLQYLGTMDDGSLNTEQVIARISREHQVICESVMDAKEKKFKELLERSSSEEEELAVYQGIMRKTALLLVNCMEFAVLSLAKFRIDSSIVNLMTPHDSVDVQDVLLDARKAASFMCQTHTILANHCPLKKEGDVYLAHQVILRMIMQKKKEMEVKTFALEDEISKTIVHWTNCCHANFLDWEKNDCSVPPSDDAMETD